MKPIVSNHAVVRWLERAEGVNMSAIRAAMDRDGQCCAGDRHLLKYIESRTGFDVEKIRRELHDKVAPALKLGARGVICKGFYISIKDGVAVTVFPSNWARFDHTAERRA